jgi:putative transposase
MSNPRIFRYFKTSPKIIRLAVTMYVRYPPSLRNVEDLLHERGSDKSLPLPRQRVRSIPQHFKPIALVFAPPLLRNCWRWCYP